MDEIDEITVRNLPEASALLDRARGLAMVDAIRETRVEIAEWGGWGGYTLSAPAAGHPCRVLTTHEQPQGLDVHFHPEGVFILGWDRDCGALLPRAEVERVVAEQVPAAFQDCPLSPAHERHWCQMTEDEVLFNFACWRPDGAERWQQTELDERLVNEHVMRVGEEPQSLLLYDLIKPAPEMLCLGSETVRGMFPDDLQDGEEIPWKETGLTSAEAIRHVLALRPLTDQVVQTLNPFLSAADLAKDIEAIGYPQAAGGTDEMGGCG
ncbi:hypothetical protein [Streptomyces sp. NPDC057301]|uniref:hypothetical protein n=1 Tax=Streptomyces sp. NPDC057301 TaxID=3346093 RepID=UPI0036414F0E